MTDSAQSEPKKSARAIRQALIWWQQRQITQRETWAEMLREEAFQTLFALRRSLELSLDEEGDNLVEARQRWLRGLEELAADLDKLKQSLHPAFVEDSLPLALRQKMVFWEQHLPGVQFKLTLLTVGLPNSAYDNWLILDLLEEWLLAIEGAFDDGDVVAFSLETDLSEQQLLMTLSGAHLAVAVPVYETPFQSLVTLFAALMGGQCTVQIQEEQIVWCLRWHTRVNQALMISLKE